MRQLVSALLAAAVVLTGPGAAAQNKKNASRARLGAVAAPVRLVPSTSAPLHVGGLRSYFGTIELKAASDGLVVVNRLSLERYLLGLQEVPSSWPMEALKAQAVAARTYALWTLAAPRAGSAATYGFDICATVACQVFAGADVVTSPNGVRWASAVGATEGEAILYGGRPILARYHSTSGGRTFDNAQIYTSEPNYAYLRGVASTTEGGSPLHRWETRFPVRRLERILRDAGWWSGNGRLLGARTIPSRTGKHYPDVEYIGRRGRTVTTAEELRVLVRTAAPRMFPGRYPGRWPTTSGRLPETFPSNRLEISTGKGVVRVVGRGWGHGVGMSQWGAQGLARAGAAYTDILRHYYTGVSIGPVAPDGPISVGVAWGRRNVSVTGAFLLVDARGRTLVDDGLGTWRFRAAGAGVVSVQPPKGYGLPLEVGIVDSPQQVEVGEAAYLTIALSRPARVRTMTDAPTGYDDPGARVKEAGRRRVVWLAPLEPGDYEVKVRAASGGARRESDPVRIVVAEPPPPVEEAALPEVAEDDLARGTGELFPFVLAGVVLLVLMAGLFGLLASRMKG